MILLTCVVVIFGRQSSHWRHKRKTIRTTCFQQQEIKSKNEKEWSFGPFIWIKKNGKLNAFTTSNNTAFDSILFSCNRTRIETFFIFYRYCDCGEIVEVECHLMQIRHSPSLATTWIHWLELSLFAWPLRKLRISECLRSLLIFPQCSRPVEWESLQYRKKILVSRQQDCEDEISIAPFCMLSISRRWRGKRRNLTVSLR